jgi:hypothetical protein
MSDTKKIKQAVKEFFNGEKYVYATPDTLNHNSNFYGDTRVCRLCQRDVVGCIEMMESMCDDNEDPIEIVLDDLQYEKPSKN